MKRLFSVMTMFCLMLLMTAPVQAQNPSCICAHMPMYQVSGGWYHYATVHAANCAYLYPTGYVDSNALPSQNCSGNCAACTPLDPVIGEPPPFYFGAETTPVPLVPHGQMNTDAHFRTYLQRIRQHELVPNPDPQVPPPAINHYGNYTFEFRTTVQLFRVDGTTPFYAAIFQVRHVRFPTLISYAGVEISETGVGVTNPVRRFSQCNALHTFKQENQVRNLPVPGLLLVQFSPAGELAVVRLHGPSNRNELFPSCPSGRENGLVQPGGGSITGENVHGGHSPIAGQGSCNTPSLPAYCPTRRVRGRKCWK